MGIISLNPQKEPELSALAIKVNNLQTKCDLFERLLGEIIATFNIERNQEFIHPKLKEFAELWTVRYKQACSIDT